MTVKRLLELNIATPRTPISIGNWASEDDGEFIGSAAQIVKMPSTPNSLTLYHGTSSIRAVDILRNGMNPIGSESRIWNRVVKSKIPQHRDESVYLTGLLMLAEYYSKKATNTDKKRLSPRYLERMQDSIGDFEQSARIKGMSEDKIKETVTGKQRTYDFLKKLSTNEINLFPVILEITIPKSQYGNLLADDDYINKYRDRGVEVDQSDWRESLSDFGQVAYRGSVAPNQIKIKK